MKRQADKTITFTNGISITIYHDAEDGSYGCYAHGVGPDGAPWQGDSSMGYETAEEAEGDARLYYGRATE
jgi:hypothetical protein